jgi:glycogen operon protein
MRADDWHDGTRRTLGIYLAEDDPQRGQDAAFLVWLHAGADPVRVALPAGPWAHTYTVVATSAGEHELPAEKIGAGAHLELPGRTVAVLQVD